MDQVNRMAIIFVVLFPEPLAVIAATMLLAEDPDDEAICNLMLVVAASVTTATIGNTAPAPEDEA